MPPTDIHPCPKCGGKMIETIEEIDHDRFTCLVCRYTWARFLKSARPVIKVYCSKCVEWFSEETVRVENIEEGFDGADVLTFHCPRCASIQRSNRITAKR